MEKQTALGSRQTLLVFKTFACLVGLTFVGLLFAPQKASMQNSNANRATNLNRATTNKANKISVNANSYRTANAMIAPTPEPPKSTVRGRVFYEDTGRNVKRASIMLMTKEMRGREISALTDNDGNFEMKNVPAGTYYAFVNAPGVVSPLAFADISKPRSDGFEDATENFQPIVTDGLSDIFVQVPAKRGGAISGRVVYAEGDPAIGVKVEVLRKVKDKFLAVIPNMSSMISMMTGSAGGFQTDDRGVYRFSGLPAGEYIVKVTESATHGTAKVNDYNPFGELFGASSLLTTYFPDVSDAKKAQIVNVALGLEQPEINITISDRNLFRVEGKVIAAKDKSPLKGAKIYLQRDKDNTFSLFDEIGKRQQMTVADEQGNWSFKELPKGDYKIVVEPPPVNYEDDPAAYMNMNANVYMSNRASNAPPKPRLAKKSQTIVVEDKSLSDVVVELGYGASISGTISTENNQEMPNGITVSIGKDDETSSSTTLYNFEESGPGKPKNSREFKLEGVAEGKANFRVYVGGDDFYVKNILFNGADLLVKPLVLKEGDNLRNVQIVLSKDVGTVKGKVTNGDNQPAARAEFSLVPIDAAKRENSSLFKNIKTNENGEFETKLAPGEYAILFFGENKCEKDGAECDQWLADAVKNAAKVTIKPNETEKLSLVAPK